ncbi:MAG TPA: DMT family transporter [Microvirga sp.]|jgi:drug/metabolite transporter (DMT)-like permease|nr:DMT family transporter [Microvirga sp.]
MKVRDLLLLLLVCLTWAVHTVVSKMVVSGMEIPPLFYAAVRYGLVCLMVLPWLLPLPKPLWRTALVGLLMGGGSFALFFTGMKTATPSGSAIVQQLGLPMMTLLSVLMLGETPDRKRWLGSALTFSGALLVMWDPNGVSFTGGLIFVAASAFLGSLASVMMKQVRGVRPLQFQAWAGLTSVLLLGPLTATLEDGQFQQAAAAGWPFLAAVLFSAVVVSLLTHTIYYGLLLRYPANLIAPMMVFNPLMTVALGIAVTHDPLDLRVGLGTVLALTGVLVVTMNAEQAARLRAWTQMRLR